MEQVQQSEAIAVRQPEQADDGMRFKCSGCDAYVMPGDPGGRQQLKCDQCEEWFFTLCKECAPNAATWVQGAVWLCPECR